MKTLKPLSIRLKILVIFMVIFILVSSLMTYFLRGFYFNAFEDFETISVKESMTKVNGEIDQLVARVSASAHDWAIWDDTHDFANNPNANQDYIEKNLVDENFDNYNVDLILFVDKEGKLLYGKERIQSIVTPIDPDRFAAIKTFGIFENQKSADSFKGIVVIKDKPLIIAAYPILKTNETGTVAGHVVFAYNLDDIALEDMGKRQNMSLVSQTILAADRKDLEGILASPITLTVKDSKNIIGRLYLPDLQFENYIEISAHLPRTIMGIGYQTVTLITLVVPLVLFIVLAILLLSVNWLVLSRITNLNQQVLHIVKDQSPSDRLNIGGSNDEISQLSESLNLMLDGLQSLQIGLSEAKETLELKVIDRTNALQITNRRLEVEMEERKLIQDEVTYLAYHDNLTGLPNRLLLTDRINQSILMASRKESLLSVIFIDLDGFKVINDTLGHQQGDILLQQVGERLTSCIRKNDTVCRIGGDEFVLFINGYQDESNLDLIATKVINSFKVPFMLKDQAYYITSSMGIAQYPIDGDDVESLMKNADMAMYEAKNRGKNQYQKCSQHLRDSALETMAIINNLHRAIERGEMALYYQPQVNTKTGLIDGVEALLRWHHPTQGFIPPSKFVPIAEKTRLILPIGLWVLRTACQQSKDWRNKGLKPIRMAVNFSIHQMNQPNIIQIISDVLQEFSLRPNQFEMELTESIAMDQKGQIKEVLRHLKEIGISLSIDDFGTEYSSLSRLKELPIDRIKIDISFVSGIGQSEKDEAIIKTILLLAKNLGLQTIAEGVETPEELAFLTNLGCDEVQGYLIAKPLNAVDMEKMLRNERPL